MNFFIILILGFLTVCSILLGVDEVISLAFGKYLWVSLVILIGIPLYYLLKWLEVGRYIMTRKKLKKYDVRTYDNEDGTLIR